MPPQTSQPQPGCGSPIAANKYEGSIHFVLFVAVLFWLLTLALFFLTLLDKQDLVPLLGGERWLCTNLAHDRGRRRALPAAIGVMIYKTDRNSLLQPELYQHLLSVQGLPDRRRVRLPVLLAYLVSVIYGACRKCRGEQTVI
ncbi:hypothetical protein KUCAC02_024504 [Chaenocephalus aceratus]|uniref:Uncharacterized protein n=1 Tax=Chaenocephalus aceratus TaxID=36190 RepID=A0ACB9WI75_CHAAC|nr:hypothetical protein KUCAC02_024504 [Chaenocephalus aceratus]